MTFQYPQLHYARPHYACVPLPPLFAQPPTLDPILQRLQSGVVMTWSVHEHPSTASIYMALPYGEVWQDRPATSPSCSSMTIWSKQTKDRPIFIEGNPYVTIGDVLLCVYSAIRFAAKEHYRPTPQPLLLHHPPQHPPQPVPDIDERQMRQWVLCYLNGHNTWQGLKFHDLDSWWLDVRR